MALAKSSTWIVVRMFQSVEISERLRRTSFFVFGLAMGSPR
jgi:hypothetical protein